MLQGIPIRNFEDDEESINSIEAPPFSPSIADFDEVSSVNEESSDEDVDQGSMIAEGNSSHTTSMDASVSAASVSIPVPCTDVSIQPTTTTPIPSTSLEISGCWKGYKLVGDNIDKNILWSVRHSTSRYI